MPAERKIAQSPLPATPPKGDARTARSRSATMAAAIKLFREKGYAGFSINEITRLTGIAKTTIYRHWPTQSALLTDVLAELALSVPVPDRGSLRDDLIAFHLSGAHPVEADGKSHQLLSLAGLLQVAEREPGVADHVQFALTVTMNTLRILIERGRARGEVRSDIDVDTMVQIFLGVMFVKRSIVREELSAEQFGAIIDAVLDGLRRVAPSSPATIAPQG